MSTSVTFQPISGWRVTTTTTITTAPTTTTTTTTTTTSYHIHIPFSICLYLNWGFTWISQHFSFLWEWAFDNLSFLSLYYKIFWTDSLNKICHIHPQLYWSLSLSLSLSLSPRKTIHHLKSLPDVIEAYTWKQVPQNQKSWIWWTHTLFPCSLHLSLPLSLPLSFTTSVIYWKNYLSLSLCLPLSLSIYHI